MVILEFYFSRKWLNKKKNFDKRIKCIQVINHSVINYKVIRFYLIIQRAKNKEEKFLKIIEKHLMNSMQLRIIILIKICLHCINNRESR